MTGRSRLLWWLLPAALAVAACDDTTGLRLRLTLTRGLIVDELLVQGSVGDEEAFAPGRVPDRPRRLAAEGEALLVLVPDALDGETVDLAIAGFDDGEVVARAAASAGVARGRVVDVDVRLGRGGEGEGEGEVGGEGEGEGEGEVVGEGEGEGEVAGEGEGEGEGLCAAPCTFLDDENARCDDGERCSYACVDGRCDVRGEGEGSGVSVVCAAGSDCKLACNSVDGEGDACRVDCLTGARCRLECNSARSCELYCAPGSDCRVERCNSSNDGRRESCGPFGL